MSQYSVQANEWQLGTGLPDVPGSPQHRAQSTQGHAASAPEVAPLLLAGEDQGCADFLAGGYAMLRRRVRRQVPNARG
jgi:hypothetical protein